MLDHSCCHCRYVNSEESFPVSIEYGIEVFVEDDSLQKCIVCGHIDFPIEAVEVVDNSVKEKRNHPHSFHLPYLQLIDLY